MALPLSLRDERGFTLVELATVVVIVATLGAVLIPRILNDSSWSQRGYVDELASTLRYAQRIAIASDCDVSVTVDAGGYSASMRADEVACDASSGPFSTPVLRADRTPLSRVTPSDVTLYGSDIIVFSRDGSIENLAPASFRVGPFTITLDRETGAVRVTP